MLIDYSHTSTLPPPLSTSPPHTYQPHSQGKKLTVLLQRLPRPSLQASTPLLARHLLYGLACKEGPKQLGDRMGLHHDLAIALQASFLAAFQCLESHRQALQERIAGYG